MSSVVVIGALQCTDSKSSSAAGWAVRSSSVVENALQPATPDLMYHTFAARFCSMMSDGETASWLWTENATTGVVHWRALPVDISMILFEVSTTTRNTWMRRRVAGSKAWSGSEL